MSHDLLNRIDQRTRLAGHNRLALLLFRLGGRQLFGVNVFKVQEVLRPREGKVPATIRVPLWTMWHYTLGHIREATLGSESLFLLKGERHAPVYPMDFQRPLEERAQIQSLMVAP